MTKNKLETINDLWSFAMETAAEAAAESAERFQLSYRAAFILLRYMEKWTWNYVMDCPKNRGWMTKAYQAAVIEADRLAFKLARYYRVPTEEQKKLLVELESELHDALK